MNENNPASNDEITSTVIVKTETQNIERKGRTNCVGSRRSHGRGVRGHEPTFKGEMPS